jgi:hypothetical protein
VNLGTDVSRAGQGQVVNAVLLVVERGPGRLAMAGFPTNTLSRRFTRTCRIIGFTMNALDSIRRSSVPALVAGLLLLTAGGCRSVPASTLERRDVQNFSASPLDVQGLRLVRVTGLAMHSALAVQRVETQTEDGAVRVRIEMALAKKDQTGSFDVVVLVPDSASKVEFGDERAVIWPPASGGK